MIKNYKLIKLIVGEWWKSQSKSKKTHIKTISLIVATPFVVWLNSFIWMELILPIPKEPLTNLDYVFTPLILTAVVGLILLGLYIAYSALFRWMDK